MFPASAQAWDSEIVPGCPQAPPCVTMSCLQRLLSAMTQNAGGGLGAGGRDTNPLISQGPTSPLSSCRVISCLCMVACAGLSQSSKPLPTRISISYLRCRHTGWAQAGTPHPFPATLNEHAGEGRSWPHLSLLSPSVTVTWLCPSPPKCACVAPAAWLC